MVTSHAYTLPLAPFEDLNTLCPGVSMILVIAEKALTHTIETYRAGSRNALVLEDGATLFDLTRSKYSLSGEYGKCLLHLWSEERNTVRRVLDAQERKGTLQLTV